MKKDCNEMTEKEYSNYEAVIKRRALKKGYRIYKQLDAYGCPGYMIANIDTNMVVFGDILDIININICIRTK